MGSSQRGDRWVGGNGWLGKDGRGHGLQDSGGFRRWVEGLSSVYVGNIQLGEDGRKLTQWINGITKVVDWVVLVRVWPRRGFKFGFFRFKDRRGARDVIRRLDGMVWGGRRLRVGWAIPRSANGRLGGNLQLARRKDENKEQVPERRRLKMNTPGKEKVGNDEVGVDAGWRDDRSYAQVVKNG